MLDVIADFWKPAKKGSAEKLNPEQLQPGSAIGFGFVPQTLLSGRRLTIGAINTYQFGEETLTSFVLTQQEDAGVSMIVAEAESEQYLAISRRIPPVDRVRLFDNTDLENIISKPDITRLDCTASVPEFKNWVVAAYKREINGMKGRIFKGDFRKTSLPAADQGQEFEYTLLVSDSNEYAIEIEKYGDGRIEVYATIYRRMNDVGEITHPNAESGARPDIKLASRRDQGVPLFQEMDKTPVVTPAQAPVIAAEPAKPQPITLQDFVEATVPAPEKIEAPKTDIKTEAKPDVKPTTIKPEEKPKMAPEPAQETKMNGASNMSPSEAAKPTLYVQQAQETYKQEIKAVNKPMNNFEADNIECDLRVANKIIDEAIRNEMRLSDVVRRIIELPVANPESVQIPMTLTDEDYALLGIRYGISSSDKNGIKRRIIEDLNDFSGSAKKAA